VKGRGENVHSGSRQDGWKCARTKKESGGSEKRGRQIHNGGGSPGRKTEGLLGESETVKRAPKHVEIRQAWIRTKCKIRWKSKVTWEGKGGEKEEPGSIQKNGYDAIRDCV